MAFETTSRGNLTETCEQHDDKLLEMFCRQHNVVCCSICLVTKHKFCDDKHYIPLFADGFSKTPEVSRIEAELHKVKQDLLRMKSLRQHDRPRIKEEMERMLAPVKDCRRKINAHLDKLEETVIREANQRYQNYHESIQKDLTKCDETIKKIDEAVERFRNADTQNEPQLFVNVKTVAESMDGWREVGRQIHDQLGNETLRFTVDESIVDYVTSLQKLGTFIEQLKRPRKPRVLIREEDAIMKMKDDEKTCRIRGSCCLPDGGALLADWSNNKLKRVDSSYRVTDYLKMDYPLAVCYIQHRSEAAVSMGNEQSIIQIVSVGIRMKVVRSIMLAGQQCHGVTYNNGLMYVTQYSKLCVYDYQTGQLQTTVYSDGNGQKLFSNNFHHVTTNLDGTRIWLADFCKGLILLDKDLQLLCVVTDTDLEGVTGVCTDHDDVLVFGYTSRSVLQLIQDEEKISTLVPRDGLPASPWSACFDTTRLRLIVTMEYYDSIRVYHLR